MADQSVRQKLGQAFEAPAGAAATFGAGGFPEELQGIITQRPYTLEQRIRIGSYIAAGSLAAACLLVGTLTMLNVMPWAARWATDFVLSALILGVGPYAIFKARDQRRIAKMDDKFPDFLRDLAESARAGMTLPRALVTAAKGHYGALNGEIAKMSAQVQWGVGFTESLERFAARSGSPLVRRIVALIIEARRAGGNVADVLTAAADDAREIKQIVEGRNNQMKSYGIVIYVTFAVFLGIIWVMQAQFLPAFKTAAIAVASAPQVAGLGLKDFDTDQYNTLFFHAAIIQAVFGGFIAGLLKKGNALSGLVSVVVMVGCAWFVFRVLTGV